jgi:hypothetical protein
MPYRVLSEEDLLGQVEKEKGFAPHMESALNQMEGDGWSLHSIIDRPEGVRKFRTYVFVKDGSR